MHRWTLPLVVASLLVAAALGWSLSGCTAIQAAPDGGLGDGGDGGPKTCVFDQSHFDDGCVFGP